MSTLLEHCNNNLYDDGKFAHEDEIIFLKSVKRELNYTPDKSTSEVKEKSNNLNIVKNMCGPHDRDTCLFAITIAIDNLQEEKETHVKLDKG